MRTVDVNLPEHSYPIYIGEGVMEQASLWQDFLSGDRALVVTNVTVAPLYLQRVTKALQKAGVHVSQVVLPDGEVYKDWQTLNQIFDALLGAHCERNSTLVALGGGVIGDMGGFAAACYQRGMPFIQVPTTLLAQVDSSVGGKTAINHPLGKNMIGAFHQPNLVLADTLALNTLDDRQLSAGISEIIKIALIRDAALFAWLEENVLKILNRVPDILIEAIARACANKAAVVAGDEKERGERALLNLGHTFGHAIEAGLGYGAWLHGEAVAAGTLMAAELSEKEGWIAQSDLERIEQLFLKARLPIVGPDGLVPARYVELMRHDKKVECGRHRLVLLKAIGEAHVFEVEDEVAVMDAIRKRIKPAADE